jgi:hypothetical protein
MCRIHRQGRCRSLNLFLFGMCMCAWLLYTCIYTNVHAHVHSNHTHACLVCMCMATMCMVTIYMHVYCACAWLLCAWVLYACMFSVHVHDYYIHAWLLHTYMYSVHVHDYYIHACIVSICMITIYMHVLCDISKLYMPHIRHPSRTHACMHTFEMIYTYTSKCIHTNKITKQEEMVWGRSFDHC